MHAAWHHRWRHPYDVQDMTLDHFMDIVNATTSATRARSHAYLSTAVNLLHPELEKDVLPAVEDPLATAVGASRRRVNAWLSSPNSTTHLHYDHSHNLFVQVRGAKRFVLFSSEHWERLYTLSRLHPGYRQAQVTLADGKEDESLFPMLRGTPCVDITMHAGGDMLYIPPMHFHEVMSLQQSYSVNSYFMTDTARIVPAIFNTRPRWSEPTFGGLLGDKLSHSTREAAAVAFLRAAIPRALRAIYEREAREEEDDQVVARTFARRLYATRHAPRAARRGGDFMFDSHDESYMGEYAQETHACHDRLLPPLLTRNLHARAAATSEHFKKLARAVRGTGASAEMVLAVRTRPCPLPLSYRPSAGVGTPPRCLPNCARARVWQHSRRQGLCVAQDYCEEVVWGMAGMWHTAPYGIVRTIRIIQECV